jgi:PKD repeat protein
MKNPKSFLKTLCASVFFIVASLSACKKDTDDISGKTPEPCFTLAVDTIRPGEAVTFTNCTKNADAYTWTFGDGVASSTDKNPSYTYNNEGTYTVTLKATNSGAGKIENLTKVVIVKSCQAGYEGAGCTTVSRTKFLSDYRAVEVGTFSQKDSFDISITAVTGADVSNVLISNFYNSGGDLGATVTGNKITIPSQSPGGSGIEIHGAGTFSNNKITITYTVTDGSNQDIVSAIWTKK